MRVTYTFRNLGPNSVMCYAIFIKSGQPSLCFSDRMGTIGSDSLSVIALRTLFNQFSNTLLFILQMIVTILLISALPEIVLSKPTSRNISSTSASTFGPASSEVSYDTSLSHESTVWTGSTTVNTNGYYSNKSTEDTSENSQTTTEYTQETSWQNLPTSSVRTTPGQTHDTNTLHTLITTQNQRDVSETGEFQRTL